MDISILITVAGSFISILLMINAHFTRKTLEKISTVELKLTELLVKHDATDERSRDNKVSIAKMNERLHDLESIVRNITIEQ